jgi:hypothetical protein
MRRLLVSALVVFAAAASILSITFPIPLPSISTYVSSSVLTAINPETIVDYSTSTVTCAGSPPACYEQILQYTTTATWSAETTHVKTLSSTSTTLVPIAFSGLWGNISTVLFLLLLLISGALLAKSTIFRHTMKTDQTRESPKD